MLMMFLGTTPTQRDGSVRIIGAADLAFVVIAGPRGFHLHAVSPFASETGEALGSALL
jgi:hypothetical protein